MFVPLNSVAGKMINTTIGNNLKSSVLAVLPKPVQLKPASPAPSKPTPAPQGVQVSISKPTPKEIEIQSKSAATALAYSVAKGDQTAAAKAQTTLSNLAASSQKTIQAVVKLDGGSGGTSKTPTKTPPPSVGGNLPHIDPNVKNSTHANPYNGSITTTAGSSTVPQVVVSPKPSAVNIAEYNKQVEQAKLDYQIAAYSGDKAKMLEAQNRSNYYRDMGATLQSGAETGATKQLSSYFGQNDLVKRALKEGSTEAINQAMHQLINDKTWAQNNNDPAGAKAAEAVAKHLASLGGTISPNATLQESKKVIAAQQKPAPTPANNSSDKKTNSLILDFIPGVGNVKGGLEAATGRDAVTNEPLSPLDRIFAGGGLLVGGFAKVIGKSAKVISKSDDAVQAGAQAGGQLTAGMIRNVGDDVLDQMEKAGGHLLQKHVAQTNEDMIKRAMQEGVSVSTFTNKSTATAAVKENLQANADEIVKWLNDKDSLTTKAFTAKHDHPIGKGVEEGSKHVNYNLDESKIILKKDPSQQLGFMILTGHPIVE